MTPLSLVLVPLVTLLSCQDECSENVNLIPLCSNQKSTLGPYQ